MGNLLFGLFLCGSILALALSPTEFTTLVLWERWFAGGIAGVTFVAIIWTTALEGR